MVRGGAALVASGVTPNTSTETVTLSTGGATLLVAVLSSNGIPTMSDSVGGNSNTWNYLTQVGGSRMAYAFAATGGGALNTGASHVFTPAPAANFASCAVFAFSGTLTTASVFDVANQTANIPNGGPGGTYQPGSITPSQSGDILVTGFGTSGALSAVSVNDSFTGIQQLDPSNNWATLAAAYLLNASASAINPTWTATINASAPNCMIASFKTH